MINELGRQRLFRIRITEFPSRDEYVEFYARGDEDFEIGSKDLIAFSYIGNEMYIVQNFSTNQFLNLRRDLTGSANRNRAQQTTNRSTVPTKRHRPPQESGGPVDAFRQANESYNNNRETSFGMHAQLVRLGILLMAIILLLVILSAVIS